MCNFIAAIVDVWITHSGNTIGNKQRQCVLILKDMDVCIRQSWYQILTISINDNGLSTGVDATDLVWTASGADMTSVQFLAISESGGKLLCWCALSTAAFSVTSGNTLTVSFNSAGIFTMQ